MRNRTALVIAIVVVLAFGALWMSGAVLAQRGPVQRGPGQGGPGGPGGMMPPPPPCIGMLKAGATGVYVLAGPTLIKYNSALEQQGTLELIAKPTTTDTTAPPPPLHGAMLIVPASGTAAEKVLVVIGDKFFAIDGATFDISATGTLPAIELPDDQASADQQRPMGPPPGPGGLEYYGGTLYVQRGPGITAINIADGSVAGQATLPKPAAQ